MSNASRCLTLAAAILISMSVPGHAQLTVIGPGISGDYSVTDGTTLWSLVQNVTTNTPPGDNGKNAILRDYVVATGSNGTTSVFSLGELNPNFGGTNTAPFIGVNGSTYSLIDPNANAAGRNVSNLASLKVFAVAALPNGAGGQSSSVNLSGSVTNPGQYTLSNLQNNFTPVHETVGTDVYTGVPLFTFINPSNPNILNQIVITSGTDGYEVVLSLAELDPIFGGNPANLLPYADTEGDFPTNGIARTILPLDNRHGRWLSNLDSVIVVQAAVPEPSTRAMMLIGFAGLGFVFRQSRRKTSFA
jgi:PEP-CTERM motif